MSHNNFTEITKDNIEYFLKEVAKEYRKQVGKSMPAELIVIGGASVLINYDFRYATKDVDAIIYAASAMKDAINKVGDMNNLADRWINEDFKRTASYSPVLIEVSQYYKTFSNVLAIRTVSAEYLIAMKLRSARTYRNDFSDILGILEEHKSKNQLITLNQIKNAVERLYGSWDVISEYSKSFLTDAFADDKFKANYEKVSDDENTIRETLNRFNEKYPDTLSEENVDEVINNLVDDNELFVLKQLKQEKNK